MEFFFIKAFSTKSNLGKHAERCSMGRTAVTSLISGDIAFARGGNAIRVTSEILETRDDQKSADVTGFSLGLTSSSINTKLADKTSVGASPDIVSPDNAHEETRPKVNKTWGITGVCVEERGSDANASLKGCSSQSEKHCNGNDFTNKLYYDVTNQYDLL